MDKTKESSHILLSIAHAASDFVESWHDRCPDKKRSSFSRMKELVEKWKNKTSTGRHLEPVGKGITSSNHEFHHYFPRHIGNGKRSS